jgi:hypothetical protein
MTPPLTPGCAPCVVVVAVEPVVPVLVGAAGLVFAPELVLPPELGFAPELVFATGLVFAPELGFATGLVFAPEAAGPAGAAPLFATCVAGVLPPLGVRVPVAALLLGVPVPELLPGADV